MLNITDPAEARKIIRADKYDKQTAGIAGKICTRKPLYITK
jgi:uncharacterized protein YcsI (UPF0317 family)